MYRDLRTGRVTSLNDSDAGEKDEARRRNEVVWERERNERTHKLKGRDLNGGVWGVRC